MGGIVVIIEDRPIPPVPVPGRPTPPSPATDLATYERQAFSRHLVFDLRTPLLSVGLLIAVCAWLMQDRVPVAWIAAWVSFGVAANLVRAG